MNESHDHFGGLLWLALEDEMRGWDRGQNRVRSKPLNLPKAFRPHQAVAFGLDIHHGDLRSG
jgi:hypothetical protein